MKIQQILPFARSLMESALTTDDIAIDGTVGNGHDTLFLAQLVGPTGHVYGFDIQEQAIINTTKRLQENQAHQVTLFHRGHENILDSIPKSDHGKIKGALFNLGYLPGGDKTIVTRPNTTITAIEQLLDIMAPSGVIVLVIYHGHDEGQIERDQILKYVKSIDQKVAHVVHYGFLNHTNHPPFIVAIEKRD